MKANFSHLAKWFRGKLEDTPGIILWGLLMRFWFMAFSGHHDAFFIPWMSNWLTEGHWQLYAFFYQMAESAKSELIWLSNPPLPYWSLAAWMWLMKSIGVLSVVGWDYLSPTQVQIFFTHRMLFFTKGIYLVFDMATLWLLVRLVPPSRRNLITALWCLSPIVLFSSYVMGQTDIFPVFWVTCALWAAKRYFDPIQNASSERWLGLGAVCIGIGAAYKIWPLLLLPGFVLMSTKQRKLQFLLLLAGLSPLLVTLLPYLPGKAFREWVLLGHGVGFLDISPKLWIQEPSMFLIMTTLGLAFGFLWQGERNFDYLWQSLAFTLFGFFSLNSYWEFYWMLWLMPFIVLIAAEFPQGWFFWFFQSVYYWLYMIGGWFLGLHVFLRVSPPLANVPEMVAFVFGTGEMRYKVLTALFSIWVVSLWMPLLIVFLQKTGKKTMFLIEQKYAELLVMVTQAIALAAFMVLISYAALSSDPALGERLPTILAQNINRDQSFFVLWFVLCGLICSLLGLKMWFRLRRQKSAFQQ